MRFLFSLLVVLSPLGSLLAWAQPSEKEIQALIRSLQDQSPEIRDKALIAVARSRSAIHAAFPVLFEKRDSLNAKTLFFAFGKMPSRAKDTLPILVKALDGEHAEQALRALQDLQFAVRDATPALIKSFQA